MGFWGNLWSRTFGSKTESGDNIFFEKQGEGKREEYILEDNEGYFDHKEPKRMPQEELIMPMKHEEIESNNLIGIVGENGKPVNPADLARQVQEQAKMGSMEIVIPGQIKRDAHGNIIGKNPLPNTIPVPVHGGTVRQAPIGSPNQQPAYYPQQPQYQQPYQPQPQTQFVPVNQPHAPSNISAPVAGPTYSMYTVEDAFYVFVDIPGADRTPGSLAIKVKENKVVDLQCQLVDFSEMVSNIEREKKEIKKRGAKIILEKKGNRQEKFSWAFGLSRPIVTNKVTASWSDNGVLQLYLPFQDQSESEVQIQVL